MFYILSSYQSNGIWHTVRVCLYSFESSRGLLKARVESNIEKNRRNKIDYHTYL